MNVLKNIFCFAALALLVLSCVKEDDIYTPILTDIEPTIEDRTIIENRIEPCDFKLRIVEILPACYPSTAEYGRYQLLGQPKGENINIKWQAEHATIMHVNKDEVRILPNSRYEYIIRANVYIRGCERQIEHRSFIPHTDCPY